MDDATNDVRNRKPKGMGLQPSMSRHLTIWPEIKYQIVRIVLSLYVFQLEIQAVFGDVRFLYFRVLYGYQKAHSFRGSKKLNILSQSVCNTSNKPQLILTTCLTF